VLTDDMDAIDALKKEKSEKSKSMEEVLNTLVGAGAVVSNRTFALPAVGAGEPPPMPFPANPVGVTAGDPYPAHSTTLVPTTSAIQESNGSGVTVDFSGGASGGP